MFSVLLRLSFPSVTNVHAFCHENYSLTDVLHMRGHAFKRAVNTDEFQSVSEVELSGLQALHRVAERFIDFCGHNRAPSDQRSCTLRIKQTYAGNHVVAHYAQERVQTKERRNIGQSGLRQRLDELAQLRPCAQSQSSCGSSRGADAGPPPEADAEK